MNLTPICKELIIFFKKNQHINISTINTKNTNKILTNLYNEMILATQYINTLSFTKNIKLIKPLNVILPQHFNINTLPLKINKYIKNSMNTEVSYVFSLNNRKIQVYFITEKKQIPKNKYDKCMFNIAIWLFMLHKYGSVNCASILTIYIYLTPFKKYIPNDSNIVLDAEHVNTAFTSSCPINGEIVIFREEEWFKVFIHETFHTFGLDFSTINNNVINKCISQIYKIKSNLNIFESYAEFWAEIINILFCSIYTVNKSIETLENFIKKSEQLINLEKKMSLLQLVKVLDFMNLKYENLYSNTLLSNSIRSNYKEKTNVMSYYIIKSLLMFNYNEFITWCDLNNTNLLNFKKTNNNLILLCDFITKYYKANKLTTEINNAYDLMCKIKTSNAQIAKVILTTMRMSICELC